jgi:hypothetical protein
MLFCVRYNVADQEFWDNNFGANFQVEFRKRPNYLLRRSTLPAEMKGIARRASDDSAIGDDFDIDILPETFAKNLADQISSPRSVLLANLGESAPFVKKATLSSTPSASSDIVNGTLQKRPTGKVFANRYDFSASLSAAIANANMTIGPERSGLGGQKSSSPKATNASDSYFAPLPLLFRESPPVQSPNELIKEDSLVNNIKKSHLSGLQQSHHFRSRSYPLGSPGQSPNWQVEGVKEGYTSDDSSEKPPIDSNSYLDFINNYCFFEPGKSDVPHPPTSDPKAAPPETSASNLLAPPQFPIRATARSPPPSPRKLSPVRTREEPKPRFSSFREYHGSSSDSNSAESSGSSTPRAASPQLVRSPERSRDHSRDSSPSMTHYRHHPSPLSFDTPGAQPTAIAG